MNKTLFLLLTIFCAFSFADTWMAPVKVKDVGIKTNLLGNDNVTYIAFTYGAWEPHTSFMFIIQDNEQSRTTAKILYATLLQAQINGWGVNGWYIDKSASGTPYGIMTNINTVKP